MFAHQAMTMPIKRRLLEALDLMIWQHGSDGWIAIAFAASTEIRRKADAFRKFRDNATVPIPHRKN